MILYFNPKSLNYRLDATKAKLENELHSTKQTLVYLNVFLLLICLN